VGAPVRVEVRLFANLADRLPGRRGEPMVVDLPAGATVETLLERLALPPDLPRLVLVNGVDARPVDRLAPGDVVSVLPPLVGG
jgi:molybdopterin converting factor small subunit